MVENHYEIVYRVMVEDLFLLFLRAHPTWNLSLQSTFYDFLTSWFTNPFKIMLHFFLKLFLGYEMIFLPSKNELLPKLSLCLLDRFNFLLALGHALSFSHDLFYLTVVVTHHE
jgi:hypothetical protein